MDSLHAFCPQCKQDVQFQQYGALTVCSACGYSYERTAAPMPETPRQSLTALQIILFIFWILLPSFLALGFQKFLFDPKAGPQAWLPYALLLTAANSLLATFWLARRVSQRRFLTIFLGLLLGGMVFGLNVTVAFLGACAAALTGGNL
jgi:uncharacterized membrane protein